MNPVNDPRYWLWERWMHGHREFKKYGPKNWAHRPNLPKPVPLAWRTRHLRYHLVKPPIDPPPVVRPSVFSGRCLMTAWDPMIVLSEHLNLRGKIDAIALKADGDDATTPAIAARIHQAGFRVLVWEATPTHGQAAVDAFGASGYIGQAEGPSQLQAALALEPGLRCEKALVCNTHMQTWPDGWVALGEAYANVNPKATPMGLAFELTVKRDAKEYHPVFGLYDGSSEDPVNGKRIPLKDYFTMKNGWLDRGNWWGYLAEHLAAGDVEAV